MEYVLYNVALATIRVEAAAMIAHAAPHVAEGCSGTS